MNLFKRFLACSLAVLMMSGMLMTGVAAKSFNDVASEDRYSESINVLSDIGVVVGTSENEFSPSENVTREQMALFLFRIMLGKQDAGTTNSSQFLDLYDVTYNGAISWASASGYIIGTSETTFNPVGGITFQDALTMLVRALGYGNKQMDAGYPWTYIDQAIKLGLDNHMEDVDYNKTLTRAEVASVLYNALTADYLIPKNVIGGTTFYETTTIIEYVFGYQMETAVLAATNN